MARNDILRLWGANKQPAENWQGGRNTHTMMCTRMRGSTPAPHEGGGLLAHSSRARGRRRVLPQQTPKTHQHVHRGPHHACPLSLAQHHPSIARTMWPLTTSVQQEPRTYSVHASPKGSGAPNVLWGQHHRRTNSQNTSFCSNRGWQFTRTGVILVLWDKEE